MAKKKKAKKKSFRTEFGFYQAIPFGSLGGAKKKMAKKKKKK